MIYDDKNIYYNYTMKYICKDRQIVKLTMYSPHNEPFVFSINVMNFCMELSKTEFTARVSFTYGTSKNCLWPSPYVCVDVGVKV